MKDHNDYLPHDIQLIKYSLQALSEQGYRDGGQDAKLNYLHFLRDEVNKLIRQEKKGWKR